MPAKFIAVQDLDLSSLEPFPGNPRRGNVAEIRKSLRRLGQYRSLVVRLVDGRKVILAGNHTSKAMALEGWTSARCELVECDDGEARRINAVDNRLGELPDPETGERYDRESLAELLSSFDGDYEGTGWAEEDLAAMLADTGEAAGGEGDAPEDELAPVFGVIVTCESEQQQARLLERLDDEGFSVRALMAL